MTARDAPLIDRVSRDTRGRGPPWHRGTGSVRGGGAGRPGRGATTVIALIVSVLITQGLPIPPSPPASAQTAGDPPPPVVAEPIPDEAREPAPVDIDLNSVLSPEEVVPDPGAGKTVTALMDEEILLLDQGGPDFDVYAPEDGVGAHFLVLYPEVVNEQNAEGEWVDLPTTFRRFGDGWSIEGETFSVIFPGTLAAGYPITHNTESGSISQVPAGVVPSRGELRTDGSLIYRDVLPATDAVFEVAPGGFKETLVLRDASAPVAFDWTLVVEGYALTTTDDGSIQLVDETGAVLEMAPAAITDASKPVKTSSAPYVLSDPGDGTITMSLKIDPAFVASATYPIEVDPATATPSVLNDTYVSQASGGSSYGGNNPLITGPGFSGTKRYRAFIRFATAWEQSQPLVYSAELRIKNTAQSNSSHPLQIHRANWDWGNTMTWNGMMTQANEGVGNLPTMPTFTGPTSGQWTLELKKLYQAFSYGTYPDFGFRLASDSTKKFNSVEASGTANDPYLVVSYNDLPNPPSIDGPVEGKVFETAGGVTLALSRIPVDDNGDEVLVRYQVTPTQGDWAAGENSGWTDAKTFDVPPDWLSGDGPFYWRVQSADVCSQPDTLCDNVDGNGDTVAWPATTERSFTIHTRNWGEDPRYATWTQDLGNGMTAMVNEANGNLFVRIPLDRVPTPGGPLAVGLSYNSQADAEGLDRGLGPGWRFWAGPESSGRNLPVELEVLTPAPWSGVKITYRSGRSETYGWRGGSTYSMIGAGSGVLHENKDNTWVLRSADGDVYTFDQNERLDEIRPVSAKPSLAAGQIAFSYDFDANGNLISVTDAIGRVARFNWAQMGGSQRLDTIGLWTNTTHTFDLGYTGGTLTGVTNPEGETVSITDGANCGSGLLSEIRNGEQTLDVTPGWRVGYVNEGQQGFAVCRVERLWPPQVSGGALRWLFDYGIGGWDGTTSLTTTITDPRGVASATANDYLTTVDFNSAGLPIRIVAPKRDGETQDWITTMVWDANGNMVCSRSPQANALAGGQSKCQGASTADEFNTEYTYDTTAPFRQLSRTDPAPTTGDPRVVTTHAYDAGPSFEGLWAEIYGGPGLGGVPKAEELWSSLNQDWGAGAPGGLSSPDDFSVRLSGYLKITGSAAKNVTFQLNHDDGVSMVIEDKVLLNCFGDAGADVNCGDGEVKKKLWPGLHPITIEYQEKTGTAKLAVKWDLNGGSSFSFIPTTNLVPNLGLMTSTLRDPTGGGTALALETVYGYGGDDAKARRLPTFRTVADLDPAYTGNDDARRTEWTYDDYGRVLTTTRFADKPAFAATTTRTYTDDATARTSCLTKLKDPEGAVTRFTCNKWGDTTEVRQEIRQVTAGVETIQVAHDRVTTTTYDAVGRPTHVDHPDAGETTYDYDASGRTIQVAELLEASANPVWATTSTVYDDQGASPTITETLPDPDGAGPLTSPVIVHTLDWVGNEVARVDALGKTWTTVYDAQNRVVQTITPDPDGAGALNDLDTFTTYSVNPFRTTVTDPANVDVTSDYDIAGREVSTQRQTLAPTLTTYDALGSQVRTEVAQSGTVYSWAEQSANAFGKVYLKRTPWNDGTGVVPLTTTYTYNAAGRRSAVDGPSPKNDVREFTYDLAGRLETSRYYKGASVGYTTSVVYNDAGERLQIRSQLDDGATEFQTRRWTYTAGGLVESSTEIHDAGVFYTTTNAYDAGGRLRTVTGPRPGCVITSTPDRLGRVLAQTGNASCPGSLSFTYLPDGTIDTATDTVSNLTYDLDHDAIGRVTTVKRGGTTETTTTYNAKGQLASLTTAAGTTSYTYVGSGMHRGMLFTVDDPLFSSGVTTYAYDAAGRMATRSDSQVGAGIVWTRSYEPQTSRVSSQTIFKGTTKLGEFIVTYDEAGNVAARTERVGTDASDPRNGPTTYGYDAAGRLTTVTGPDPADPTGTVRTWGFTYDGAGNRTSETTDGVTTTWDLDAQGWPIRSDNATPGTTGDDTIYGWDRAGNLTSVDAPGTSGDQSFTLDAFDRITNANIGGTSVGYTLDAFSRVRTRTQGSSTTTYTYAGISEILATSTTGTTVTSYAHTPGGPLGERVGTADPVLYLRDLHDDVVGTVDETSTTPLSRAYYSPWGEPTWEDGTSALGFQGQLTDPGTGFVDMTTRNYMPSLGRFASQDIVFGGLRHPLSLNQWAYAEGDPITNTDPLGMGVTKDADPDDGCVGTCASDGIEPSEHGNPESGTTTEQRIFEHLVDRPVQAYLYFGEKPEDTTWQELIAMMAGRALDSIGAPYCPGGRTLCNWVPSEHERAMIQRIQALASADLEYACRAGVLCSVFTANGYAVAGIVMGLSWAGEHKCEVAGSLSWIPEGELRLDTVLASGFKVGVWGMWEFINQAIKTSRNPGAFASKFSGVFSKSLRYVGLAATAGDALCRAY